MVMWSPPNSAGSESNSRVHVVMWSPPNSAGSESNHRSTCGDNLTIIELAYVCSRFPPRRLAPRAPNFQGLIYDPTNET